VQLAAVTHAAGPSSTGDPATDAALPLPERYDIPPATVAALEAAAIASASAGVVLLTGVAAMLGRPSRAAAPRRARGLTTVQST